MLPLSDLPFFVGLVLSWSLAAPPGPANAIIADQAARRGWRAGFASGAGAVSGDVLMFLLMWAGVLALVARFAAFEVVLGAAGALLMAWFAWGAWRAARRGPDLDPHGARGGFAKCFLTVVTSPFNWAWWVTVGAAMFAELGLGVVIGFFAGLLAWIAFWSALAQAGAARMRRFAEWVGYASAVVLAAFALYLAWHAATRGAALLAGAA